MNKKPVSEIQNVFHNNQQLDDQDLTLEQNYNNTIQSSLIDNQFGSGVLVNKLIQNTLFDSLLENSYLDGYAVSTQNQPSDNNFGNQLEIELSNSNVAGKKTIKICIIGLDFFSDLQYETFTFKVNEIQIGKKHFTKILTILFNDFIGDPSISLNLGGRVTIKESKQLTMSRSTILYAQDLQPNLFFRDFYTHDNSSLSSFLQFALPLYNTNTLNILTSSLGAQSLLMNDVTTQIGQKFLATTNNIQKITLLLSVDNSVIGQQDNLEWSGDLVVSIYPLQSVIGTNDNIPNLPINFPPNNIPIAQVSINYATLTASGIVLDSNPQPVDFVFSNTSIASGNVISPNNYYALTLKRSGSANQCDILLSTGTAIDSTSWFTTFNGSLWIDIVTQSLWFKIWTDAAKITDGQAYDAGLGVIVPKTKQLPNSLTTIDYNLDLLQFSGNDIYRGVLSAVNYQNTPEPNQNTGEPVNTRQQTVPQVNLLNTIDITNLLSASNPLIVGAITDKNIKYYNSYNSLINSTLFSATMIHDELILPIIDGYGNPNNNNELVSQFLLGYLNNAKITPDINFPDITYTVASATLTSNILGDVNGDGIIDINDLNILNNYVGYNLGVGLPVDGYVSSHGTVTTFINGYNTYINPFISTTGISFQLVDGYHNIYHNTTFTDGVLVANPTDPTLAQFTSISANFNSVIGISNYNLVIISDSIIPNYGGFPITLLDTVNDVITIKKIYLTSETIMQMLRSDVDSDFQITATDVYMLTNYINRVADSGSPTTNIGTRFNILKLKLQSITDRADDYYSNFSTRGITIHAAPDIFLSDGYYAQHNFLSSPISISFQKQLTWDESLVVTNSNPRQIPTSFVAESGFSNTLCETIGVVNTIYGSQPSFDPGLVNLYAPNNVIIGNGGQIQDPDGSFYKVDFELGTIILEIPDGLFANDKMINIVSDFIADYTGDGRTRLGFPSMRFADCTYVESTAITNDQLRFSISVQSFSPNVDGYDGNTGLSGIIVDGHMGIAFDHTSGMLTINFSNLYQDETLKSLSTKIQIHVFLKKGGFNNTPLFVDSVKLQNMLQLTSAFSSVNSGSAQVLVDLTSDITGVLPIIHGGTGLGLIGANGTVLISNGSSLSYEFIPSLVTVSNTTGISDAGKNPRLDSFGYLDTSFYYKNPIRIYAVSSTVSNSTGSLMTAGALKFRFDEYILQGVHSIKLEVILETSAETAYVYLYNINTFSFLILSGSDNYLSTTNNFATVLTSDDLKSNLSTGATNYVYEIQITGTNPGDNVIIKSAALVITYNNEIGDAGLNFIPNPGF